MADKSEHGHAGTDEERHHGAAHEGGHASHEKDTAHEFNSEDATEAGRRGGRAANGAAQETEGDEQTMPRQKKTRGGTHDQHVTAGKKGGSRIRQLIELGYLYEKEHGIGPGRERRRGRRKSESGGEGETGAEGEAGGREEAAVAGGGGGGEGGAEEAE